MTVLAETLIHEVGGLPSIVYGLIALALLGGLALFTWTFRDVANRHEAKAVAYAKAHPEEDHSALNELGEDRRH